MPTQYIINQGKGFLVEIEQYDNNTGQMCFFISPHEKDYQEIANNLQDSLSAEGLKVLQAGTGARSDYIGRSMAIVIYEGTLDEAKAAVGAYRGLIANPAQLTELSYQERFALQQKHWRHKDDEWDQAQAERKSKKHRGE